MPETIKTFDTDQGKFDLDKYDKTGAKHIYSYDEQGNRHHTSLDKVLEAHHDPKLEAKWNEERKEQAREAGDVALEGVVQEPKPSSPEKPGNQEVRTGEKAIWHSRKAGKGGKNDINVIVGEKLGEKDGVVYVKIVTEDGTPYKTRADRLEYLKTPQEASSEAAEDFSNAVDEQVKNLDGIIPPTRKEKEAARDKTLEEKFDDLKKESDKRFEELKKLIEARVGIRDGNTISTPEASADVKEDSRGSSKTDENNGYPIRRDIEVAIDDGTHIGHNGKLNGKHERREDQATVVTAAPKAPEEVVVTAGAPSEMRTYPGGRRRAIGNGGGYEAGGRSADGDQVDAETMDKLDDALNKISDREKALWQEYGSASPERQKEIIDELRQLKTDRDKVEKARQDVWHAASSEEVLAGGDGETTPDGDETKQEENKRGWFGKRWDKLKKSIATNPLSRAYTNVITEQDPKKRRRYILGSFVGGIVVGVLLSKYGIHHGGGGGGGQEHGVTGSGIFPGNGTPEHGAHGIEHMDYFNSSEGHRITGAVLPDGLHFNHDSNGHRIITDNYHNVVVSHEEAPSIAKESGVLSDRAAEVLRSKDFTVGYMPVENVNNAAGNLYQSVVS
ncbi:hypothetical protein KW794_01435 [Candidatus Saccharibacteria bacterium]|nr:hypothetical protein [Candidatus Saccharibacteria bacterium]